MVLRVATLMKSLDGEEDKKYNRDGVDVLTRIRQATNSCNHFQLK